MKTIILNKEEFVAKKDYDVLAKKKAGKTIVEGNEIPFLVGEKYFIRTVTYFATGRVKAIKGHFLVLEDGAWIADTGRFRQALVDGVLNEVEPIDCEMYLNINTITDAFEWVHELPRTQK